MAIANRIVQERPVLFRQNMQVISSKEIVGAYARVSTENEEQEDSFERQCEHFTTLINSHSDWEFGGIYADQGISGTKASARKEFMRMIEDCRVGKLNRILVKSISRFARNTVDSLMFIRELKELGVSVYFESERIDTMTPGGEVLITILSAIAEQESRNMSTNIKWAYQKRFKEGEVLINYQGTLGYTKIDGQYVIVEEEAEIIRRIFREYIGGATLKRIGQRLTDEGIQTPGGKAVWQPSAVQGILKNEKYTGNAILGKTYKPDVLSKTRLENKGQAPSYYVKNSHPAIVSEETYNIVQSEMERRKDLRSSAKTGDGKYSSKYALSGLLVCSECGSKFRRFRRGLADRTVVITWVCIQHQKNIQECKMLPLKEEDILSAYKRVMNRLAGDMGEVVQTVRNNIVSELAPSQIETTAHCDDEIVNCQKRVLELFKLKRENGITPREYETRYKEYSDRIISLQAEQIELQKRDASAQLARQRIIEINEVLNNADKINSTDESIMKMLLDCIKVISKNEIEFQFKCGTTIKEEI